MTTARELFSRAALILGLTAATLIAADSYPVSLKMGDEYRGSGDFELALQEYDAALNQAGSEGEKALAMAKKAYVLAVDQKNYSAGRALAEQALAVEGLQSVAEVTALEVVARSQMNADRNFAGAVETLNKATRLAGVDWALPNLNLMLGDCHRETGDFNKAVDAYKKVLDLPSADNAIKGVAYFNMGMTQQYSLQDPSDAKRSYKKAEELNPGLAGEIAGHLSRMN